MTGTLIFGEYVDGNFDSITLELLSVSKKLKQDSSVVIFGPVPDDIANNIIKFGAGKVYIIDDPLLESQSVDAGVAALDQLCRQISPSIVLFGKNSYGIDLGTRLAFRLNVGIAQDCVDLKIDTNTNRLVATRPVYGGNALATLTFPNDDPQIAIVRGKVFEKSTENISATGDIIKFDVQLDSSMVRVKRIELMAADNESAKLEDASVIVCGGRGLGGPEAFESLREIAELLGGAVGASRAVCDSGWLDHEYQIGLTGKTVSPDLYITVGVSGASQHMSGCLGSKTIVAINKDPNANIFKDATYGAVGDWKNILPAFIETIHELVD